MAILNYTTKIDSSKTIMEIHQIIRKHKVLNISSGYEGEMPVSLSFCIEINGSLVNFLMPCRYEGVLKSMQKNKKVPRHLCTKEQALRVSWRIIKDWTASQMALIEAELAELSEVFLPYAVTKKGNTLFQELKDGGMKMLDSSND